MNIDELVQVTEDFYNDLIQHDPAKQSLGNLCLSHVSGLLTMDVRIIYLLLDASIYML